jgi:general secretion pathway protein H
MIASANAESIAAAKRSSACSLEPTVVSLTRGFTLMEMLVVMVIIGVIVATATLSVGILGRDREAEEQARRLWAVLVQGREEAELQGLDAGVFIHAQGYEFLQFDPRQNRWVPIEDDRLFAPRSLPEGLGFRLWLESKAIVMKPDAVDRSDPSEDKKWPPQVLVLSSGDILPFELQIEREHQPAIWRVLSLPDGDVRLERRDGTEAWDVIAQTKPPEEEKSIRKVRNEKR